MVDEAHERSLSTDLLLGLLRKVQVRRGGDLRIMLSSATLDVSPMVDFFGGKDRVAVVDVRGRSYPVEILYCKEAPVEDFLKAAENAVRSIHRRSLELEKDLNSHGILVFVTSPEDVLDLVASLSFDALELGIQPLALFASLPMKDQQKALEFSSKNLRKVVVATNVAESSLTVPGISYVIDCGLQKSKVFNPNGSLNSLCIVPISKATAKQRAGRAGRIGPGICFRLYSEQFTQESMAQSTPPEILRCELTTALLQLKALGIENILKFPFPTKPRAESIAHALDVLHSIGALDSDGRLTEDVGSHLIELPLSPQTGRCLVEAWHLGCEQEVAAIFAMLECGGFRVFRTGASQQWKALEKSIAPFAVAEGDLLSLLNVYQAYQDSGRSSEWCKNRGIFARPMDQAFEIRLRLLRALPKKYECGAMKGDLVGKLLRCIISGFHAQIVAVLPDGTYRAVTTAERGIGGPRNSRVLNDRRFAPHPGSVLYNRFPSLMVYCNSLERPGSEYIHMQNVTAVPAKMVADLVPDFYRISRG
uniref:Helicase C-terminal domain-containing protein n=1 Tax=Compsopogon caeruleus TaxID=31354 RepID=A0A6T6B4F5_9RHOD